MSLPAGSPVDLEVRAGGLTVEATGNLPEVPIITAPAGGTAFTLADSITITWTSATNPDGFEVYFGDLTDFCCDALGSPQGTARQLKIAGSDIGVGGGSIMVDALNQGSFIGPADPDSYMNIRSAATGTEITIGP